MLGDIQKGRLDMACGRFRMTADRAHILNFTYPTQFEVNQVYLITDTQKSEDVGFLFRPFSTIVWLLLIITILVVFLIFFVLRAIEFRGKENILKKGTYRLFTPSSDRIPECPQEIPNSKCISIFSEILSRHPPEYGDVTQLNDRDFVSSVLKFSPIQQRKLLILQQNVPLVGFGWYPAQRISSKFSIWTQELFHSNVWLIRDFPVCPAAYIRIDNHYTPAYPELSLFEKPSKSSFTLNQLSSIFVIHLLGTLFSSLLLIAEIVTAGLTIHRNTDISSKKEETAPKRESENV
uniref:PBPe domain-containing protein n=1 Tax=Caenorhabditis tropicalis TaxID=1561998 RepID=A0A1I7TSM0_9PELO